MLFSTLTTGHSRIFIFLPLRLLIRHTNTPPPKHTHNPQTTKTNLEGELLSRFHVLTPQHARIPALPQTPSHRNGGHHHVTPPRLREQACQVVDLKQKEKEEEEEVKEEDDKIKMGVF
jgi:hypothetical protein